MPTPDWKPIETSWEGQPAYEEIMHAFGGKPTSRATALCVWCYAQDPDLPAGDIEALAQRDPEIPATTADGNKISSHARRQARQMLGLTTPTKKRGAPRKTKKDPQLSAIEKAVLAGFRESMSLISDYVARAEDLSAAQAAFDVARNALCQIAPEHAQTLADADPQAAEVLSNAGVLADPDSTAAGPGAAATDWADEGSDSGADDVWSQAS